MNCRFIPALAALAILHCRQPVRTHEWTVMGSNMSLSLHGRAANPPDSVFEWAEREGRRVDSLFSNYSIHSALSAVTGNVGDTLPVHPEIYCVLATALEVARASHGAFDISLHDLKRLWRIDEGGGGGVPDASAIDSIMEGNPVYGTPWEAQPFSLPVELAPPGRVVIRRPGVRLDLGAIAKGYLVDRLSTLLDSVGYPNHLLQAGGEIRMGGKKARASWLVGIRHPRSADSLAGMIRSDSALSVSTSGDYERYFELDGSRYHHIFDPRTGKPSRASNSVTVVADSSQLSDALSTALFVMGPEKGASLARRFGARAAWFVETGNGICVVEMPEIRPLLSSMTLPRCP